jgi:hypothetical protein
VFNAYEEALQKVRNEQFEKNYDSGCFFFGQPCPYYHYCRYKKMDGLIDLNEKNELTD